MVEIKCHSAFHKVNNLVIIVFLALSFIFDFIDKCEIFYHMDFIKFNRIIKALMVIYSCIFISLNWKWVLKKTPFVLYTLLFLSLILLLKFKFWSLYIDEYFRYIFLILVYPILYFSTFQFNNQVLKKNIYLVFKVVILINAAAILLGLSFDVFVFRTYKGLQRFGYNGLLLSQGLSPYVYMIATLIFWHYKNKLMLILLLAVSAFSGIKAVYFGVFMLLTSLVLFDTNLSRNAKLKISVLTTTGFLSSIALLFTMPLFKDIIIEKGLLTALFSFRIDNLIEIIQTVQPDQLNYFIGAMGLEVIRVELQLADIFLFFGLFGIIAYTIFFQRVYAQVFLNTQSKIIFATVLFLSFLSGNLLYNPLASFLFILTLLMVSNQQEKNTFN